MVRAFGMNPKVKDSIKNDALWCYFHISGVYTHANNEVLTEHLDNCKPMVNQIRPAIVVIQAGSIRLAELAHFDANPCLQIASMPKSKPRATPAPSTSCPPPGMQ